MSVRIDEAAGEHLRLAAAPDYNAAYTLLGWIHPVSTGASFAYYLVVSLDNSNFDGIYYATNSKFHLETQAGASYSDVTAINTHAVGSWRRIALVRASTTLATLYVDGVSEAVNTNNIAARAAADEVRFGSWVDNLFVADSRFFGFKLFTRALSLAELENEWAMIRPADPTSLWAWWPLLAATDIADYSGNGRGFTAGGSPSTEDNPPVTWGAQVLETV